jgi:tetratricopeptide (TPR) repeat protein
MLFESNHPGPGFRWHEALFVVVVSLGFGSGLMCCSLRSVLAAQSGSAQHLEDSKHKFQTALTLYRAGKFTDAQQQLQAVYKTNPNSFEINELTGLICAALGRDQDATPYLAKAVRINPNLPDARTALAANLVRLHRMTEAEVHLRKAAELAPETYDANHNLGELYIQLNKLQEAVPYLKRAQDINPSAYNNGYDLALASERIGNLEEARQQLADLIRVNDSAELHSLLGAIEEKSKNYLASAAQFEKAAHMDPSENNVFEWGTELLLHQTFEPATEVFKAGLARYPQSSQMKIGFGVAQYGLGNFDVGARAFLQASDMNPADRLPLIFLGQAYDNLSPAIKDQIISRFERFVQADQHDASVRYYYAMALWKQAGDSPEPARQVLVESLLKSAAASDASFADARLQLGILYANQHKFAEAIAQYEHALKINSENATVHYRLGQSLARSGATARAKEEFAEFERLRTQEVDAANKKSAEIQQFVYTLRQANKATSE